MPPDLCRSPETHKTVTNMLSVKVCLCVLVYLSLGLCLTLSVSQSVEMSASAVCTVRCVIVLEHPVQSDMWSLGVCIFCALSQDWPFKSKAAIMVRIAVVLHCWLPSRPHCNIAETRNLVQKSHAIDCDHLRKAESFDHPAPESIASDLRVNHT